MEFLETMTPPMFGLWSVFMFWIGYLGSAVVIKKIKGGE